VIPFRQLPGRSEYVQDELETGQCAGRDLSRALPEEGNATACAKLLGSWPVSEAEGRRPLPPGSSLVSEGLISSIFMVGRI
jgi:hypothetical protein